MKHDRIAVLDFGGQYAHLIATKVRRMRVRTDIVDPMSPLDVFRQYRGLILSGSPALSAYGEGADYNHDIFNLDIPILGLCYGHQEIAKRYGGRIEHTRREYGPARLRIVAESPIFAGIAGAPVVWMSHGDSVTELPPGYREIACSAYLPGATVGEAVEEGAVAEAGLERETDVESGATVVRAGAGTRGGPGSTRPAGSEPAHHEQAHSHRNAAIASEELKRYGFQFHPEVDDSEHGEEMLANFVTGICGCRPTWTIPNYVQEQIVAIRERVGGQKVFLLASGGVDSTVCARLLVAALGDERVHLLHIDNGLMRKDESRAIMDRFRAWGLTGNLHFVDASERFLSALAGLVEPEAKRLAIGNTFIDVCTEEMERIGVSGALLAQGTIYPDTIETGGTKRADVIKTHHNRVPIVEEMIAAGRVLEPLQQLYKTEVRELGAALGLDADLLNRHPFPGPGLGVRLLCSRGLDAADRATLERIEQAAARFAAPCRLRALAMPLRSVGVKADLRAYEWPVMLVDARGGSGEGSISWDSVLEAAGLIYRRVDGVNRCCYALSPMEGTLEPVVAHVTRERLDLLREADRIVMEGLARHGLMNVVWQCPTVAAPIRVGGKGSELIITRPVLSARAMTARPAIPPDALIREWREAILALPGVSGLCLDVTTKPPGTIEWE